MAEVTQTLGFDASQALSAIQSLDTQLKGLNSSLTTLAAQGFTSFNRSAGKTVAAFKQLDSAARSANKSLGTVNVNSAQFDISKGVASFQSFGSTAAQTKKFVDSIGQSLVNAGNQADDTGKKGKRAADGMTISFQTLARVITTQLIVRAFGQFQRALTDAVSSAVEFENTIAEIATIDIRGGQGFGDIANDVEQLSVAFGADLGDVGRGLYQTISNQIGQTGTAAERAANQYSFLSDAIRFSVAGVTTVESSVNLLAGTINAYGLEAEEAGRLSGQFFRTIELGRTTASELANSFGTVAPVAAQLGVSIEELQASFATITIGGLDTAKAATQIRGALTGLLKPTEDMQAAFAQLGVANGEQAIELFGFQGALEAVIGTTDGTAESIARLIPRVRGLSGVLRLTSDEGSKAFRDNLQSIITANEELLNEKFEIIFDTNARQIQRDLNELKVFLTRDFGQAVLETTNRVIQAFGGFDNIKQAVEAVVTTATTLGPVFIGAGAIIATFGVRSALASTQVGLLTKSLGLLGLAAGAVSLGNFAGAQINDLLEADNRAIDEANRQRNERAQRDADSRRAIEEASNKLILSDFKRHQADLAKENAGRIRDAQRTAEQVRAANKSAFEGIIDASEELENRLRSQFQAREGQARTATNNIKDLEQDLADTLFEQRTRTFTDQQRFFALEQRLIDQRTRAQRLLASAATQRGDTQAIDDTREAFAELTETASELQALGGRIGESSFIFRADQTAVDALRVRQRFELNLIEVLRRRQAAEKQAADAVAENNRKVKDLFAELVELQESAFEEGINTDEQDRRFDEFAKRRIEFFKLIQENAQIGGRELADFANVLNRRGFAGIVQQNLSSQSIEQLRISEDALRNARTQLSEAINGVQADAIINIVLRQVGVEGDLSINRVTQLVSDSISADEQINAIEDEISVIDARIQNAVKDLPSFQEAVDKQLAQRTQVSGTGFFAGTNLIKDAIARFNQDIITELQDGEVSQQSVEAFRQRVQQIQNAIGSLTTTQQRFVRIFFKDEIDTAGQLANRVQQIGDATARRAEKERELAAARQAAPLEEEDLEKVRAAAGIVGERARLEREAKAATDQTKESVDQVGQSGNNTAIKLSAMQTSIQAATQEVANLQTALDNLTVPDLSVSVAGPSVVTAQTGGHISRFAKGGLTYLAGGGFSRRGTDTIPAMLSPGEFVVNARSTRRFFSQLQAMNAGVQPIFRQEGGPVTNIGDINVNVSAEKDAEGTGRIVARRIRRELRRGTSTL